MRVDNRSTILLQIMKFFKKKKDMGNGRYDFESAELTNADITRQMVMNDIVLRIVKEKLKIAV